MADNEGAVSSEGELAPIGPNTEDSKLKELHGNHFPRLVRIALGRGVPPRDCEDVAQETIVDALKNHWDFDGASLSVHRESSFYELKAGLCESQQVKKKRIDFA